MAEKKTNSKFSKIINLISDILFIPVMIILIIYLIYAINVNKKNGVPSFFGQSYVRVMSGSMEASGFKVGDVAVIKKVNLSTIKVGDFVAFYYGNETPTNFNGDPSNAKDFKTGKKTFNYDIYFHKVIDIRYDTEGNTWIQTQGTSNSSPDSRLTRGDYIVGKYVKSGMSGFLNFVSSEQGLMILVIVPSCVMLLILSFVLIDTIDKIMKEKKEKESVEAQGQNLSNHVGDVSDNKEASNDVKEESEGIKEEDE